jgi:type III restriction enzyme
VKSLVLDRRKEIGALPLEFKAERDESGNPALSEGQRVMLRAGLKNCASWKSTLQALTPCATPRCWWCVKTPLSRH